MYKELIERLRLDAEWAEANEWESPIMLYDDLLAAIKAIDTLTAELIDERDRHDKLQDFEVAEAQQLKSVKAARDQAADYAQRLKAERDAAVADLAAAGLCDYCGHWNGSKCTKRGKCAFEWRGLEGRDGKEN